MSDFAMPTSKVLRDFEPCDATASMLLYAQGTTVVVAHHDTLTIERRFSRHKEEVQILAVDNVSERGAGRLVISYDAGQTAIVWDLMTGDEVARFASYNSLSVAAWMRNGNVAFGNPQGNVILFEPSTSEHISARTIDQMPITALAPAADCRTYAIGYQNGSILIASLQPRFTILHNLTTSRAPSPVVTLAWHASSSRQKSDMLATQTHDGDLRVWSIAKSPSSNDTAKVVRVLKRRENFQPGPNWLAWSKNGRIIQYSEGETASWDVRTKNVTFEIVPTLGDVRGIAIYGPGATMFTLGSNNTCQQFDLNSPPVLVANVQHPANLLPPSPPVSIEEQNAISSNSSLSEIPVNVDVSESDEDHMSPLARIAREMDKLEESQAGYGPDRSGTMSPASSQASSTSRSSAGSRSYRYRAAHGSVMSKGFSDHTLMSPGSSIHTRDPSISSRDTYSQSSLSTASTGRSRPRASRLRQEVLRSPEEKVVVDLFKYTKSRLSDIPYAQPQVLNHRNMTHDELRRQMLNTIFGWNGEVDDLIRDEMSRHPVGTPNRLLLTKWLGNIDIDIMAASSESMTASDWMLLALSGIGGQGSQQKVARAYVQRLLEKGDVHSAATIMIGMGDQNDAIEIYVSHKRYMEALILTCLVYPADWGRQTQLLRKWGEWAVQHSQQQLAIRCFSCTGADATEPYPTPNAQTLTFSPLNPSIPEMLSPPLSPPGVVPRGPQRNMAKTAALKLVTDFGNKQGKSKFFGPDDDRTPMAGVGTPIADSALSPGGDATAFHRPHQRSMLNTPASARTATPGGFTRQRLPSIGEMPTDVTPVIRMPIITIPTPKDKTANEVIAIATAHQRKNSQPENLQLSSATYQPGTRAATASPMLQRAVRPANPLPAPSPDNFTRDKVDARTRNGSRGRKPDGLQIHWPPMESIITGDYMTSADLSAASQTSSRRPPVSKSSVAGSVSSVSTSGRSYRSYGTAGTASPVTGRSLDPFISSLDAASHFARAKAKQERQESRERAKNARGRSSSKTRKAREPSLDRGRSGVRYIKPAKRSPTSPVPMSPEDLRDLGAVGFGDEPLEPSVYDKLRGRDNSQATARPGSKNTSRIRRMSPEPLKYTDSRPASRLTARQTSRKPSPNPSENSRAGRGRSKGREGSVMRSPSSPLPMSTEAAKYMRDDDDVIDLRQEQERLRQERRKDRSTSRMREKGSSRRSSPGKKNRDRSVSRSTTGRASTRPEDEARRKAPVHNRSVSDLKAGDLAQWKTERQLKRENAARELEERRRSLARRPSAPPILHPEQLSPPLSRPVSRQELLRSSTYPSPREIPTRSQTVAPEFQRLSPAIYGQSITRSQSTVHTHQRDISTTPQIGLPATPKAMQHPKYDPEGKDIPDVPMIPENYTPIPAMGSLNEIAYNNAFENLGPLPQTTFTPLPKTTYQSAPRHIPPRSMSAPIPEEPMGQRNIPNTLPAHPAFHGGLPASTRRGTADHRVSIQSQRKTPVADPAPSTGAEYAARNNYAVLANNSMSIGGIEETLAAAVHQEKKPDQGGNEMIPPPPPPPPAPPILRELQHLAMPPPPPPAPLHKNVGGYNTNDTGSLVSGVSMNSQLSSNSGVIEIVMDDGEEGSEAHSSQRNSLQNSLQNQIEQLQDQQRMLQKQQQQMGGGGGGQGQMLPPPPPPAPPIPRKSLEIVVPPSGSAPVGVGAGEGGGKASRGPPISANNPNAHHNRGRSFGDSSSNPGTSNSNSLSSRLARATERIRSSSRGKNSSPQLVRTKSPEVKLGMQGGLGGMGGSGGMMMGGMETSPYESVNMSQWGVTVGGDGTVLLPGQRGMAGGGGEGVVTERHPRDVAREMMEANMI